MEVGYYTELCPVCWGVFIAEQIEGDGYIAVNGLVHSILMGCGDDRGDSIASPRDLRITRLVSRLI